MTCKADGILLKNFFCSHAICLYSMGSIYNKCIPRFSDFLIYMVIIELIVYHILVHPLTVINLLKGALLNLPLFLISFTTLRLFSSQTLVTAVVSESLVWHSSPVELASSSSSSSSTSSSSSSSSSSSPIKTEAKQILLVCCK
uniref:Uncharacterized protein n=1 Tax=Glossina brevipalpis TaxID=37001 RepID=A0A1A9W087_9MUSC